MDEVEDERMMTSVAFVYMERHDARWRSELVEREGGVANAEYGER